jgi:hypothetical protein
MHGEAAPGIAFHYEGPIEHAIDAYERALDRGLVTWSGTSSGDRLGAFTAVLVTHCRWDHVVAMVEDLATPCFDSASAGSDTGIG